jgi:hypothetical protein
MVGEDTFEHHMIDACHASTARRIMLTEVAKSIGSRTAENSTHLVQNL